MSQSAVCVWVVDQDVATRWTLERALGVDGMTTRAFDAAEAVLAAIEHDWPDVLITEIELPGQSGLELLGAVHHLQPTLPVITMAGNADLISAVSSYEAGAFEYLPKPLDVLEALSLIKKACRARPFTGSKRDPALHIAEYLGRAPPMQPVFRAIGRLAATNITVLIKGEPGSGTELVARALHNHSPRASGPFVAADMAGIPADLLEADLFGREESRGRFEQADGGTLLLNEMGHVPSSLQSRLVRALAEGQFYRQGGPVPVRADVRVITATQHDLYERVRLGLIRSDLYFRLNGVQIEVPPLRSRPEDIPALLSHYMGQAARELGLQQPRSFSSEAVNRLVDYDWPGNVLELENLCRQLSALGPGSEVAVRDLPPHLRLLLSGDPAKSDWTQALAAWSDRKLALGEYPLHSAAEPEFERVLMRCALKLSHGQRREAARILGWSRNTLLRKSRQLEAQSPAAPAGMAGPQCA